MAQLVFEHLMLAMKKYHLQTNKEDIGATMKLQLEIMGQAALLDKITNTEMGTRMWVIFELERDSNWEQRVAKMFENFMQKGSS